MEEKNIMGEKICCETWFRETSERMWTSNLFLLSDSSTLLQLVCVLITRWRSIGNGWGCICFLLIASFFCTFSFKCRNSHWLIAKVRFEDCNNINSRQKAKIRCNCLAVSCGLEIASLLTESEQWCSHNIVTRRLASSSPFSSDASPFFPLPHVFLSELMHKSPSDCWCLEVQIQSTKLLHCLYD